jgi:DNA-directed RNA polymerase subunit omega
MARITVEDCLKRIGDENRFSLIHLAVSRVKQHRKGAPMAIKGKNKEVVMTLREIAAGRVTFDNIEALAPCPMEQIAAPETEQESTEPVPATV